MSFLGLELSRDGGRPVELFHINAGLRNWYYTSNRRNVTYLTREYIATSLRRSKIEQVREYNKSALTLNVPATNEFVRLHLTSPLEGIVTLTMYRTHADDPAGEFALYWQGRVVNVSAPGNEGTIRAEPIFTTMRGQGRRRSYSTGCSWSLYKPGCWVNEQEYKAGGLVTAIQGLSLSSGIFGAKPDGYYDGGKVVIWVNDEPFNRRIESHKGTTIVMSAIVPGLIAGGQVEVFPGCDHSFPTCGSKFNNTLNFGGFPWKPRKDPFSGSAIF